MQTLAIVHLDTSAGAIRITISEEEDGTLVAERIGSQVPHVFPVKVGQLQPTGESIDDDATQLVRIAIDEIESFAEVTAARQVRLP